MAVSTSASRALSTLLVIAIPLPAAHRARLAPHFTSIEHFPDRAAPPPPAVLARADAIYGDAAGALRHCPADSGTSAVPRLKLVQLSNAGCEDVLQGPLWAGPDAPARKAQIRLATAAGVHTASIPQYFIAATLALFHRLQDQILITQNQRRWATAEEVAGARMFVREMCTQTVGILGYGHIGRECARLAAAFGATVVAATSTGERKPQDGYTIAGTGDPDGSIPAEYYSTRSPASLAAFLARTDVLLLALPSTPSTRHILSATTLAHLRPTSIVVNVGRGDALDTAALLAALDGGQLAGAALDVADPEPLPAGHALFARRDVLLTPHLSGRTERYWERALDIFVRNLARWEEGGVLLNEVDPVRGVLTLAARG